MSLQIVIDLSKLNVAASSLENVVILMILEKIEGGISNDDLISEASEILKILNIDKQNFIDNLNFYLKELMLARLIEFRNGKYSMTMVGRNTYSLVNTPVRHIIKKTK